MTKLASVFVDYFKSPVLATQKDFEEWHEKTCKDFRNDFNAVLQLQIMLNELSTAKRRK